MNRLMIFADAEYVIQSFRKIKGKNRVQLEDINWPEIIKWVAGDRNLIRCYYYSARLDKEENSKTYEKQTEFLTNLKMNNDYLELRLGKLVKMGNNWIQKGCDVMIALDMVTKAFKDHYDIAALIAGDSDFFSLIKDVKNDYGKQVELYTFDRSDAKVRKELMLAPDKFIKINLDVGKEHNFWNS